MLKLKPDEDSEPWQKIKEGINNVAHSNAERVQTRRHRIMGLKNQNSAAKQNHVGFAFAVE